MVNIARTALQIRRLSSLSIKEVIAAEGVEIRERLTGGEFDRLPIMVCARNESRSLPLLLFALSHQTRPVKVIVINNGSTDITESVANELGAIVVNQPQGNLFDALAKGFAHLSDTNPKGGSALYTDADCFPCPTWAETMERSLNKISTLEGQVFGPVFFYGPGALKNTLRTAGKFCGDTKYVVSGRVRGRGPNGSIKWGGAE